MLSQRIMDLAKRALKEDLFSSDASCGNPDIGKTNFLEPFKTECDDHSGSVPSFCRPDGLYKNLVKSNPEYDEHPEPVMIAENIRDYFMNMPLCKSDGLLCDSFKLTGLSVTGDAYTHTSHKGWEKFFAQYSDYTPNGFVFTDWHHFCCDYDFILNHGFKGYLPKISEAIVRYTGDKEKIDFLCGLEIVCKAIKQLSERLGMLVPYEPAGSFREAVQSVWVSWMLLPDVLGGRLDQILYPFFNRDLENNVITLDDVREYIAELFIKTFSWHGIDRRNSDRSGDTSLSLGGRTRDGRDGFNMLSYVILSTRIELPIWRPQIAVRWCTDTPHEVMKFVSECNFKNADITLVNDEVFLNAFNKLGFEPSDAIEYTKMGCNEWAIPGKSFSGSSGFFNAMKALEEVLYNRAEEAEKAKNFEDFYLLYLRVQSHNVDILCNFADAFYEAISLDTNVLSSLMIESCIEKAASLTRGGAKYNVSCWSAIGLINLADSLSIIKQFVYEEKLFTLSSLFDALKSNWGKKGSSGNKYENMRAQISCSGRFFGNDDDFVDDIANRLILDLNNLVNRRKPKIGGSYRFGLYTGYNSAHISMGKRTKATPDGRYEGDPFTSAISAGPGRDKNGCTAYLKSVAKLNYSILCGVVGVNLRLLGKNPKNFDYLASLYETYFKMGGIQLQPDHVSKEDLRDAQIHPEKWSSLRVRVTGFTGFFVQFDRKLQDEIISRTEHAQ